MEGRSEGAALTRRAPVACSPSESTLTTSSRPMTAASAPYSAGPRSRAARIVKPYVVTFMIPIATAMTMPPRRVLLLVVRRLTPESVGGARHETRIGAPSTAKWQDAPRTRPGHTQDRAGQTRDRPTTDPRQTHDRPTTGPRRQGGSFERVAGS